MPAIRERPRTSDEQAIKNTVISHEEAVVTNDGNIVSKLDRIWKIISRQLNRQVQIH